MASMYLDLQAITRCEAARSGDDRQARHRLLQHLALARRAIIGIFFPPITWPMTDNEEGRMARADAVIATVGVIYYLKKTWCW